MTGKTEIAGKNSDKPSIPLRAESLHAAALEKLLRANAAAARAAKGKESADSGFTPQAVGLTPAQWNALTVDAKLLLANEWLEQRRVEMKAEAERKASRRDQP
jgi:hypothetical protein